MTEYSKMRVLVIDDEPFVREIVVRLLHGIGFKEIDQAGDGEAGLHSAIVAQPDLIICDMYMAPMDGLGFIVSLRKQVSEKLQRVPVIFLTAASDPETVRKALSSGANGYILKPVSRKTLLERIEAVFSKLKK